MKKKKNVSASSLYFLESFRAGLGAYALVPPEAETAASAKNKHQRRTTDVYYTTRHTLRRQQTARRSEGKGDKKSGGMYESVCML